MSSTVERPPVDLSARRPHAGLALALALLAIPGVTIAWDLPAGGLYTGVPLAAAAIFLGIRARRALAGGSGSVMATVAIVIGALALLSVVAGFAAGW